MVSTNTVMEPRDILKSRKTRTRRTTRKADRDLGHGDVGENELEVEGQDDRYHVHQVHAVEKVVFQTGITVKRAMNSAVKHAMHTASMMKNLSE